MSIVKSGFLHRQSTILRRWKRNWFDLWLDGRLVFYDDQQDMEDEIHMRVDCINIRSATACHDLKPPEGRSRDDLIQIVCRDGRVISVCGDNADDALAWTMALQDARISSVVDSPQVVASAPPHSEYASPPPVYVPGAYGGYAPVPPEYGTQIIYSADGQTYVVAYPYQYQGSYPMRDPEEINQVIVHERQRDDGGDVALSMLAGAVTGLALASLFSVF
ncbi:pleckstrin homology domain-containing family B member 2 isoform X2 [Esox lucius]|uniref:PH domain-containing protein n=1 Tax=Esox lucius TaxID=8010 RepID=A0A3P9A0G9_ESOLU|nr:pleckstrin homology domain-containing family B member 2 isoform X2 [Esox lucius]